MAAAHAELTLADSPVNIAPFDGKTRVAFLPHFTTGTAAQRSDGTRGNRRKPSVTPETR
jgi:hypothetical protein